MKAPPPSVKPDSSPSPKISITHLHDASPTVRLPRLALWDESVIGTVSPRPPHWDIHAWLGDACLNFSGFYFPDLPSLEAKRFAQFFKTGQCHNILVDRCYIENDKQTMSDLIKSNIPNIGRKSYSDYLEFYVGVMLKFSGMDSCEVWDIIREIVSVGLLYYIREDKNPKKLHESAQLLLNSGMSSSSNDSSNSESIVSPLHSSLASPSPSQSTKSGQSLIISSKTSLNEESVTKSASTPLLTDENVERPAPIKSPSAEGRPQSSSLPNPSKRSDRHPSRLRSSQIADECRHFIFTSFIVDEFWALSNEEQENLYRCRNVFKDLMRLLRDDLKKLTLKLSLPGQHSVPLTITKRTLEGQISEYLETNALHSETLLKALRDAEPIQEHLDNFRRQLKTIIQISKNNGTFKGGEGGKSDVWKIIGSAGTECFKGSFPQLRSFLLDPPADISQNRENKNKRTLATGPITIEKRQKNSQSYGQGNKNLDKTRK